MAENGSQTLTHKKPSLFAKISKRFSSSSTSVAAGVTPALQSVPSSQQCSKDIVSASTDHIDLASHNTTTTKINRSSSIYSSRNTTNKSGTGISTSALEVIPRSSGGGTGVYGAILTTSSPVTDTFTIPSDTDRVHDGGGLYINRSMSGSAASLSASHTKAGSSALVLHALPEEREKSVETAQSTSVISKDPLLLRSAAQNDSSYKAVFAIDPKTQRASSVHSSIVETKHVQRAAHPLHAARDVSIGSSTSIQSSGSVHKDIPIQHQIRQVQHASIGLVAPTSSTSPVKSTKAKSYQYIENNTNGQAVVNKDLPLYSTDHMLTTSPISTLDFSEKTPTTQNTGDTLCKRNSINKDELLLCETSSSTNINSPIHVGDVVKEAHSHIIAADGRTAHRASMPPRLIHTRNTPSLTTATEMGNKTDTQASRQSPDRPSLPPSCSSSHIKLSKQSSSSQIHSTGEKGFGARVDQTGSSTSINNSNALSKLRHKPGFLVVSVNKTNNVPASPVHPAHSRVSGDNSTTTLGGLRSRSGSMSVKTHESTGDDLLAKLRVVVRTRLQSPNSQQTIQAESSMQSITDVEAQSPKGGARIRAKTWSAKVPGCNPYIFDGRLNTSIAGSGLMNAHAATNTSAIPASPFQQPIASIGAEKGPFLRGMTLAQLREAQVSTAGRPTLKSALDFTKMNLRAASTSSFPEGSMPAVGGLGAMSNTTTPAPRSAFAPSGGMTPPHPNAGRGSTSRLSYGLTTIAGRSLSESANGSLDQRPKTRPRNYSYTSSTSPMNPANSQSLVMPQSSLFDESGTPISTSESRLASGSSSNDSGVVSPTNSILRSGRLVTRGYDLSASAPSPRQNSVQRRMRSQTLNTSFTSSNSSNSSAIPNSPHISITKESPGEWGDIRDRNPAQISAPENHALLHASNSRIHTHTATLDPTSAFKASSSDFGTSLTHALGTSHQLSASQKRATLTAQHLYNVGLESIISQPTSPSGSTQGVHATHSERSSVCSTYSLVHPSMTTRSPLAAGVITAAATTDTDTHDSRQENDDSSGEESYLATCSSEASQNNHFQASLRLDSSLNSSRRSTSMYGDSISRSARQNTYTRHDNILNSKALSVSKSTPRYETLDSTAVVADEISDMHQDLCRRNNHHVAFNHIVDQHEDNIEVSFWPSVDSDSSGAQERLSTNFMIDDNHSDTSSIFNHETLLVRCFPRSSSGLCTLHPGWETEVFMDPRYNIWRRSILEALQQQMDYPLVMPVNLSAALTDDFGEN
ncbi:hypothetical protein BASA50_005190 [Batrachochytrium salamandrivorans]|uniref:Uncharacterized protein n=1 Tax=Batrachochytrium salamandrivorans TaxID=1357716 RepID=A0ABQ8FDQ7_9FUNG|nr:hypothetical protein BASA50_005190 [Batrachochytrium salamandrivorans]